MNPKTSRPSAANDFVFAYYTSRPAITFGKHRMIGCNTVDGSFNVASFFRLPNVKFSAWLGAFICSAYIAAASV
jgi:hypothetical protein